MRDVGRVLLLLGLLAGCSGGHDLDERIAVPRGGRLEVDLDRGDGLRPDPGWLVVQSQDADEVRILTETSEWGASAVRFRVDHEAGVVRVLGRVTGAFSWMFGGPRIEAQIWVPREFELDLRSTHGPIRIEDTSGRIRARTADGSIEVAHAEGDVRLRTSGDVQVSEVTGNVDVRLTEGDIEASWIRGDLELRTGSGEIDASHIDGQVVARTDRGGIELQDVRGPVDAVSERGSLYASFMADPAGRIETSRGSVEVLLPVRARAQLEAVARSGGVEIDPELTSPPLPRRDQLTASLGGGGAILRLFSGRGAVRVRAR
jgi:hypothetical protein